MLYGEVLCNCTVYEDILYVSLSMISVISVAKFPHMNAFASCMPFVLRTGAIDTICIGFGLMDALVHRGVISVYRELKVFPLLIA